MKKIAALLIFAVSAWTLCAQSQQQRLEKHIYYMAADSLKGRAAGSADAAKVAGYVEREFRSMGLEPFFGSFRQPFGEGRYCNVVAVAKGCDPVLRDEYIVIGAHYDHLGVKGGEVYNGADDNASGTAAVIEVARFLASHRPQLKRSVILCAFDAEEIGLYGSGELSERLHEMGLDNRVRVMMSLDMVGWLRQGGSLRMVGTGTLAGGDDLLQEVARQVGINVRLKHFESSILTATDTQPFAKLGIPTLAVTTGLKSPYHRPADDAELIDYPGLSQVADYIAALALRMASDSWAAAPSGRIAFIHQTRRAAFTVAPRAGLLNTSLKLPEQHLSLDSRAGFVGGASAQWNAGRAWGLQLDVFYAYGRSLYPRADNLMRSPAALSQHSLMFPLKAQLMLGSPSESVRLGLGGYYAYIFSLSSSEGLPDYYRLRPHQYGMQVNIGFQLGRWLIDLTTYSSFAPLFVPSDSETAFVPKVWQSSFALTLGLEL